MATIQALREHYLAERAEPGQTAELAFFGGALPPLEWLDALGGPARVRVRPDLLSRADADALAARGVTMVELDALTFDDRALSEIGRRYRGALVREQLEGIRALGMRTGIVLAPGLPATGFDTAIADARIAAELVDTCRIHPVLVLHGSGLREEHEARQYIPLSLGQAVTVCRAMMDILEPAGVEVIRVGLQPGPDGLGRAVAGPRHSALRELVEARRTLDLLRREVRALRPLPGDRVVVRCAPADETRTRGPLNQHIRDLRAEHGLAEVRIVADGELERGQWAVERLAHE